MRDKEIKEFVSEMIEKYEFDEEDIDRWAKIQDDKNKN